MLVFAHKWGEPCANKSIVKEHSNIFSNLKSLINITESLINTYTCQIYKGFHQSNI
jgi:hypothetical protein